ncbi:MAG: polysaccharide deacetylase family protein [Solirubrobacteraceae bacterium]
MPESPHPPDRLAARRRDERARRARRRRLGAGAALLVAALAVGAVAIAASGGGSSARAPRTGAAGDTLRVRLPAAPPPRLGPIPPARPGPARVLTRGSPRRREVALTFDDGFCARCVARIVAVLRRTGAHATFFPNGRYADSWDRQAATIRALVARGQLVVGNHTFSHLQATAVGPAAFGADLQRNEEWIERTFHVTGRPYVRPPYGAYDQGTLDAAGRLGYTTVVMWSGTVADSSPRTVPYLLNAIRYWAKPGAIILMHGNYPATPRALPEMLRILRSKRLRPVTIAELARG